MFKNSGSFRFHKNKTKKHWKHYFLDDETGDWRFRTEYIDPVKAQFLKRKKRYKRTYICFDCDRMFYAYVKRKTETVECTFCNE